MQSLLIMSHTQDDQQLLRRVIQGVICHEMPRMRINDLLTQDTYALKFTSYTDAM